MSRVFVGVGSNQGDRLELISQAIQRLGRLSGIRVVQMATISETRPVGGPAQPDFLNTVVELDTAHAPQELLRMLQTLERELGRVPSSVRWGPRPIDLDVLLYDDRVIQEPNLTIPHARLHVRRFVLEPLAQLAPMAVHPVLGQTIDALRARLPDLPAPHQDIPREARQAGPSLV